MAELARTVGLASALGLGADGTHTRIHLPPHVCVAGTCPQCPVCCALLCVYPWWCVFVGFLLASSCVCMCIVHADPSRLVGGTSGAATPQQAQVIANTKELLIVVCLHRLINRCAEAAALLSAGKDTLTITHTLTRSDNSHVPRGRHMPNWTHPSVMHCQLLLLAYSQQHSIRLVPTALPYQLPPLHCVLSSPPVCSC